jgi:hypothetical protein
VSFFAAAAFVKGRLAGFAPGRPQKKHWDVIPHPNDRRVILIIAKPPVRLRRQMSVLALGLSFETG